MITVLAFRKLFGGISVHRDGAVLRVRSICLIVRLRIRNTGVTVPMMQDQITGASPTAEHRSSWRAKLEVEITSTPEGTRLGRRVHSGPLRIQRPFFPEGASILHLYLLHPPGGVVGGDTLETSIDVRHGAHALITTPAAQKIYRSSGAESQILTTLRVESEGSLEWLPAETIVYSGARSRNHWQIHLDPDATFMGWEVVCLGRPASNSPFVSGSVTYGLELTIGDRLEVLDRIRLEGGSEILQSHVGLAGHDCMGTFICSSPNTAALEQAALTMSGVLTQLEIGPFGVTRMGCVQVLRVHGHGVSQVTRGLVSAWRAARPVVLGHAAHEPRVWST